MPCLSWDTYFIHWLNLRNFKIDVIMKPPLVILFVILFTFHNGLIAQKGSEGVYLSADHFIMRKVSYPNDRPGKKYQLLFNEFSRPASIKIITDDTTVTLAKDEIFGYRDKTGTNYRFYKKAVFEILNPAEHILLYKNAAGGGSLKDKTLVTTYYFSETAASPIYPLTKHYLSVIFAKEVQFVDLLNLYFRFDDELTVYDSVKKIYFLNDIYKESKLENEQKRGKINEYDTKCSIF